MHAYFSQFGDIIALRLNRNKKSGNSKHFGFIKFASTEVAKIVTATMNKYLLFGHILQVNLLNPDDVPKDLFKGKNGKPSRKTFKAVPRNKIEGRRLRLPMDRESWDKRIETENKRRKEKEEKLMALGYKFKAPKLKTTEAIPFRKHVTKASTETQSKAEETISGNSVDGSQPVKVNQDAVDTPSAIVRTKVKGTGRSGKRKG